MPDFVLCYYMARLLLLLRCASGWMRDVSLDGASFRFFAGVKMTKFRTLLLAGAVAALGVVGTANAGILARIMHEAMSLNFHDVGYAT